MTTLADLVLGAQQRCDRVNASTITTPEWYSYVNSSAKELYAKITNLDEDYNVKALFVTLQGGNQTNNSFQVGPNTACPDFKNPRILQLVIQGNVANTPYVPIPRLESLMEQHLYSYPAIVPVYGAIPTRWNIIGNTIEIYPPNITGNQYRLLYIPKLPELTKPDDTIDQYWMTINGWDEYVILDVAAKALIKEESLDTAQLILQQKMQIEQRILMEGKPRDRSQPKAITDMNRVRSPWGAWGGWGGGGGGDGYGQGGCW